MSIYLSNLNLNGLFGSSEPSKKLFINKMANSDLNTDSDGYAVMKQSDSPHISTEMGFELSQETCPKKEEEQEVTYNRNIFLMKYLHDLPFDVKNYSITPNNANITGNNDPNAIKEEVSNSSYNELEGNEDLTSDSTKESVFSIDSIKLEFCESMRIKSLLSAAIGSEVQELLRRKTLKVLQSISEEEREYILAVLPSLMDSFQNINPRCFLYAVDNSFEHMLVQLLENKKRTIAAENLYIKILVKNEVRNLKESMPYSAIDEEDLSIIHRREKKIHKGNRNASSLNHINENYISNIFQFAKKNFPDDKEIQRIANIRNVSASSFKKMMKTKLLDSSLTRRAKLRILECGRELLINLEHWMNEGYFEQCKDREKYIFHKFKALADLGLAEKVSIK